MANELDMDRWTDRDKPKTFYEKTSARSSLVAVSCDVPKRDHHHFPSKGRGSDERRTTARGLVIFFLWLGRL